MRDAYVTGVLTFALPFLVMAVRRRNDLWVARETRGATAHADPAAPCSVLEVVPGLVDLVIAAADEGVDDILTRPARKSGVSGPGCDYVCGCSPRRRWTIR